MSKNKINIIFSQCKELYIDSLKVKCDLSKDIREICNENDCDLNEIRDIFDTKKSIDLIEEKINHYLPLITERMVGLHDFKEKEFWKYSIFFYLKDLIAVTHHYFNLIETFFDPLVHDLNIAKSPEIPPLIGIQGLMDSSYFHVYPQGVEYFVGEYFRLFYPNKFQEMTIGTPNLKLSNDRKSTRFEKLKLANLLNLTYRKITKYFDKRVSVIICNMNVSMWNVLRLFLVSKGKVLNVDIHQPVNEVAEAREYDEKLRNGLFRLFGDTDDKYEQYLCKCLKSSFPWSLLEGFSDTYINQVSFWKKYPNVSTVISEIMYQEHSFALAVAQHSGKKIIKMPHFFPIENNYAYKLNEILTKDFTSIAKGNFQLKKFNRLISGSLYPYKIKTKKKKIPLLYISTDFYPNFLPFELSADGNGYVVSNHFSVFVKNLFGRLSDSVINDIHIKMRPEHVCNPIRLKYKEGVTILNCNVRASEYISTSKLVLIEGMSTAFFESISSNVPTIAFWPDIYYASACYENYWKKLVDVGVIFNDSIALAQHLEEIHTHPDGWWESEEVQFVKNEFLESHLHLNKQLEKSIINIL